MLESEARSTDLLADVLGIEHLVADFTLEAAQVPVLVQCYEGLFVLKLLPTAAAVCKDNEMEREISRELMKIKTNQS